MVYLPSFAMGNASSGKEVGGSSLLPTQKIVRKRIRTRSRGKSVEKDVNEDVLKQFETRGNDGHTAELSYFVKSNDGYYPSTSLCFLYPYCSFAFRTGYTNL